MLSPMIRCRCLPGACLFCAFNVFSGRKRFNSKGRSYPSKRRCVAANSTERKGITKDEFENAKPILR